MAKINTIALKIPNLGEAESTEIIEVNIKVGDKVNVNDPLIVLESEKAACLLYTSPSPRDCQ